MSEVIIRDLAGMGEFRQAESLQNAVWGKEDTADPADLMMVIQAEGGLCAGAFLEDRLIGYVFGFPTREPGVQHSHRLAVLPEARGMHLGARLKWYQRDWCLARGISLVRWTFDPLRRVNASLNIGTLGCIVRTYHADYYGEMQGINAGLPSDRLLAEWRLGSEQVAALAQGRKAPQIPSCTILSPGIPHDIDELVRTDPSKALVERMRLREKLRHAFDQGLFIIGYDRIAHAYCLASTDDMR